MKVTKEYQDWLAVMKKAAEVVTFLQTKDQSDDIKSLMFANVVSTSLASADGLLMLMRRGEKELAGDNVKPTVQGDLFPATPTDRAVVQSDIRDLVETWFRDTTEHDDTGRKNGGAKNDQGEDDTAPAAVRDVLVALDPNLTWPSVEEIAAWKPADRVEVDQWAKQQAAGENFELPAVIAFWITANEAPEVWDKMRGKTTETEEPEPPSSLAAIVKARIFTAGGDGMNDDDVFASFDDISGICEDLEPVLWALIHTGEVEVQRPELIYRAESPDLVLDVMRMLAEQPDLGTEDGLPEAEIVSYAITTAEEAVGELEGVPAMVEVVSLFIHRKGRVTKGEILQEFVDLGEDESSIVEAVKWLTEKGRIEEEGAEHVVAGGSGEGLDYIEFEELQALYLEEIGSKPGRRTADTMRLAIRVARAAKQDAADEDPNTEAETEVEPDAGSSIR